MPGLERYAVASERAEQLTAICRRFDVVILYAFGSRAKEMQAWMAGGREPLAAGPSDVDIGAKPAPQTHWNVQNKVDFALALEDFFGCHWVDLVSLDDADPFLAANIIRGERLYADDAHAADEYDLYVLRRAGDLIPLERERIRLILDKST
jgi:hypothetical protein